MDSIVREVALPPDVWRLARAAAGAPGLAVLASDPRGAVIPEDARFSFVAADPVERATSLLPPAAPGEASIRGWAGLPAAPRWIGVLPYEHGRNRERPGWTPWTRSSPSASPPTEFPLPRRGGGRAVGSPDPRPAPAIVQPMWHRYDAVARIDHATGRVAIEADDAAAFDRLFATLRRAPSPVARATLRPLPPAEPPSAHVERVREVLSFIAAGDVYQVNLARRLAYAFEGEPLDAFAALAAAAPSPYGFFADFGDVAVCAQSPELALEARRGRLRTMPIKGTRPRGDDEAHDRAHSLALDADPKERAELTMAVDLHRNDLGQVAAIGSVRASPARLLRGRTVWSRGAEVVARLSPGATLDDAVRAFLPSGSVTGAPKVRAMEIIASLEPERRGLYTGLLGYVGRDGGLVLAMAIRTLEIEARALARYGTGGGIVEGSIPERELAETEWKAAHLAALVAKRAAEPHENVPENLAQSAHWP